MTQATFRFISDASGGDQFTVVRFSGHEAISTLYRYEIELKAPLSAGIVLDDILDEAVRFESEIDGQVFPVHGVLASFDEMQTVQDEVYYRAELVPRIWRLSTYKTNEIYTEEKTVDRIIAQVFKNAGFEDGYCDLNGLDKSGLLSRDYVCQFGESDFDFISRLMENEGIFYYFEQDGGTSEKMILINDMNYHEIPRPGLIYDVATRSSRQHDSINAWSCRKQPLPASVTVRDFNPQQPSHDISDTISIDQKGQGTEYIYGCNVVDSSEATYLSEIRAQEHLCTKTRYYGESGVTRLQAGHLFGLKGHPNGAYNGVEYLAVEVNHEGEHLDMEKSGSSRRKAESRPQYRNSFVAMGSDEQYRPPRKTAKPRFYGTMTAFIYAETGSSNKPEVDALGRYRVLLPFDRADGTKDANDPERKASIWIRMAQPYVGLDQGTYFPLTNGTEVLLTFINGDPDQPIISGALPNAAEPSLMENNPDWSSFVTGLVTANITSHVHNISTNRTIATSNTSAIDSNRDDIAELQAEHVPKPIPTGPNAHHINDGSQPDIDIGMIPPWTGEPNDAVPPHPVAYNESLVKFKTYNKDFVAEDMVTADLDKVSTDRSGGDNYVYANGRTFAYPQHERVYFIGTFHEDFHVKDGFLNPSESWTGEREQWGFPEPGAQYPENTDPVNDSDEVVNPSGIRGVSEDRRWGDQLTFAWGRSFNWSAGAQMNNSENKATDNGNAFGEFNYGNGYTENLITSTGGDSEAILNPGNTLEADELHKDCWDYSTGWAPEKPFNLAKIMTPIIIGISAMAGIGGAVKTGAKVGAKVGISALFAARGIGQAIWGRPELEDATTLEPGNTAVEKTIGNTYSYQMGLVVDIHEGNSISRTYGDSDELIQGNAESVVQGDSVSTTMGATSEAFLGSKYEFNFATSDTLSISSTSDIQLGTKFELFWGAQLGIKAGPDTQLGTESFKIWKVKGDIATTDLEAKINDIKKTQGAEIELATAKLKKVTTALNTSTFTNSFSSLAIHA